MKIFFQENLNRLVYIDKEATNEFWDELWNYENFEAIVKSTPNSYVAKETKRYLKKESLILEGGCGRGQHVYSLSVNGFNVKGLDGLKGLKDEIKFGRKLLSRIYNAKSLSLKIIRALLTYPLNFFSNHSILLIAQK